MSAQHTYTATIVWQRGASERFVDSRYSRAHEWRFDGGTVVPASAAVANVPPGCANPAAVDPEEAFVAALSSCHMLFFLWYAGREGFVVERYEDAAVGTMGKNADGKVAMLEVVLQPRVEWGGEKHPTAEQVEALHHRSHDDCFIANSVRTDVRVLARK